MFNDYWMRDQGFIDRPTTGDLQDLITRRHAEHEDYTLLPDTPLMQAVKMMRLYDVSQMAILNQDGELEGILDESDILLAITRNAGAFSHPVSQYMTRNLETVSANDSIDTLIPIFQADRIAIVVQGGEYLGLITRIDLINYLRKRMAT
jgi:cystathionine beta-synthase